LRDIAQTDRGKIVRLDVFDGSLGEQRILARRDTRTAGRTQIFGAFPLRDHRRLPSALPLVKLARWCGSCPTTTALRGAGRKVCTSISIGNLRQVRFEVGGRDELPSSPAHSSFLWHHFIRNDVRELARIRTVIRTLRSTARRLDVQTRAATVRTQTSAPARPLRRQQPPQRGAQTQ
jgi:hypothetical protein